MLIFHKKKSGFTLIETLLYISVAAVMLLGMVLFVDVLLQSRIKNQTINEVEGQGVAILQIVTQALRNAESVSVPSVGILNIVGKDGKQVVFDNASTTLRLTENGNVPVDLISERVQLESLDFKILSSDNIHQAVKIFFVLNHFNAEGRNEYSYKESFEDTVALRN